MGQSIDGFILNGLLGGGALLEEVSPWEHDFEGYIFKEEGTLPLL
jgi:hypothetical protein